MFRRLLAVSLAALGFAGLPGQPAAGQRATAKVAREQTRSDRGELPETPFSRPAA
jgi:hypothetical protein